MENNDVNGVHPAENNEGYRLIEQTSRLVRKKEFSERLGVSETTLWRLIKLEIVPEPIQISERLSGWHELDVREFLEQFRRKGITGESLGIPKQDGKSASVCSVSTCNENKSGTTVGTGGD